MRVDHSDCDHLWGQRSPSRERDGICRVSVITIRWWRWLPLMVTLVASGWRWYLCVIATRPTLGTRWVGLAIMLVVNIFILNMWPHDGSCAAGSLTMMIIQVDIFSCYSNVRKDKRLYFYRGALTVCVWLFNIFLVLNTQISTCRGKSNFLCLKIIL